MNQIQETIKKIRGTISRYEMVEAGDKVIVGVSGGPDSVCLLDVMKTLSGELNISLMVAHFNHGLREGEDEAETRLVEEIAESMGLPFETEKASHLSRDDPSLEERAREARYAFLERVRERHGSRKIAVGHNKNDQAETVLIRLLRGAGPSGLAGISPVRDSGIIRPLIEVDRQEVIGYLDARGLSYAHDSSNTDTRYLRNRIRLELLPRMRDYQPQIIEQLCRLSNIIRDEDAYMESLASDWAGKEVEEGSNGKGDISVPLASLARLPGPLRNRVIRILLKKVKGDHYPMEHDHIASVLGLLDNCQRPQSTIDLPNGIVARKRYDSLHFTLRPPKRVGSYTYNLDGPGTYYVEAIRQTLRLEEAERGDEDIFGGGSAATAYLDAGKLQYPLVIRNLMPGDRFTPLGMKGTKKVKDFFIDLKVPSEIRASTPILTCRNSIVWVCGYRIDNRFKVSPRTEKILKIAMSS
jgi:tRNA(Ile)-lysidine synthase